MTRANPYAELADRDSAIVKAALTRKCEVCKAELGEDCTHPLRPGELLAESFCGRIVHYARVAE